MKKQLLFFFLIFLSVAGMRAQTMPELSTPGSEKWYYIRFKNLCFVLQDMGSGVNVRTKTAVSGENGQLWKIELATSSPATYVITSKLGNKIAYSGSRFITNAKGDSLLIKASSISGYIPSWEIGRRGSSLTMNQQGGAGLNKQIAEWYADAGNPLEFITPDNVPTIPAEVPLTGSAGAPAQKLALWYRYPSTSWMNQSLPIGNGQLGAMIFGGVKQDEIQFNEKTLWTGTSTSYGSYQNFGNLFITNDTVAEAVNYRRELDIENSMVRVSYTNKGVDYLREYFASYPDKSIVIRLTASQAKQLSFKMRYFNAHAEVPVYKGNSVTVQGKFNLVSYASKITLINEGGLVTTTSNSIKVDSATAVTILIHGATDFDAASLSHISNTSTLTTRVSNVVASAAAKDYNTLKNSHIADYTSLFNRVSFDIASTKNSLPTNELIKSYNASTNAGIVGNPFLNLLYFHYGRYLLISSSRGVSVPSNLQGIWNNTNAPYWSSDIHADINVQMNYWGAENTNLSELHVPFLDYIYNEALVYPQWRKNALDAKKALTTKLGGSASSVTSAKGWTLYTENNIFGANSSFALNYVAANAWYCMHVWQHYRYTMDENYLLTKAYPLMKTASEFWMERLINDRGIAMGTNILKDYAPDGTLVAPLEYSPEQGPAAEDGVAHAQQLCWDLFSTTLQAMSVLGNKVAADTAFKSQLQQTLSKLDKGIGIDKDGHLREWKYTERTAGDAQHRHCSHLMGLYPGNQISSKIDKKVYDAAVKTLTARGFSTTGWAEAWRLNLWARCNNPVNCMKVLNNALKLTATVNLDYANGGVYENLFDAHPPFQIDGNFGSSAGMAEMLMQSHTDTIDILPALPTAWPTGSIHGLKAVGNFEVDIDWSTGKATKAVVKSLSGKELRLAYTEIAKCEIKDKSGNVITPVFKGTNCAIIPTEINGEYTFTFNKANTAVEKIKGNDLFSIYPNPVENGILNIKQNVGEEVNVSIYNIIGQQVLSRKMSENVLSLDVSSLSPGIYTIKVGNGKVESTRKFIKK